MAVQIPPWEGTILRGQTCKEASHCTVEGHSAVICAKTAKPIEMPFALWVRIGPRNNVQDEGPDVPMKSGNFGGKDAHRKV